MDILQTNPKLYFSVLKCVYQGERQSSNTITNLELIDNEIEVSYFGVYANGVNTINVDDNYMVSQADQAIELINITGVATVHDNWIVTLEEGSAVHVHDSEQAVITDNIAFTPAGGAVYLQSVKEFAVSGNGFESGNYGIRVDGNHPSAAQGDTKEIMDNTFISSETAINLDEADNIVVLHNTIRSDAWVDNNGENNVFNDETSGNTYYFADNTPSWDVYDIVDSNGDNWADEGGDLPFSQGVLYDADNDESPWWGGGFDAHPYTLVAGESSGEGASPLPPQHSPGGPRGGQHSQPSCSALPPGAKPELYRADRSGTEATLWIHPGGNPYTGFIVWYGEGNSIEAYADMFEYRDASGMVVRTIRDLDPQQTYSFAVQSMNDCAFSETSAALQLGSKTATVFTTESILKKLLAGMSIGSSAP